ncbi:helix-loop-helix DNA-binding domain-containing protein [Phakopsora pachyrhizi]|nr:helix-loop-helix DNA-binding domain-containing protein [Phakopsora pachyrhizi]
MVDENQLPLHHLNQLYLSPNPVLNNNHLSNNSLVNNNIFTNAELIDSLINNNNQSSPSSANQSYNHLNNNNTNNNIGKHRLARDWIPSPSPSSSVSPLSLPFNQNHNNSNTHQHQSVPILSTESIDQFYPINPKSSSSLSQASSPSIQTELYSPASTRSPSELFVSPNPKQATSNGDSSVHASSLDQISSQFIDHHHHHHHRQHSFVDGKPTDHPLFSQSHLLYHHRLHQRGIVSSVPDRLSNHHLSPQQPKLEAIDTSVQQKEILIEKKRRRRESHNAVERRRRDNINDRISELAQLLPDSVLETTSGLRHSSGVINVVDEPILESSPQNQSQQSDSGSNLNVANNSTSPSQKPNKGVILAKSVDYIKHLKELLDMHMRRNRDLELQLDQLKLQGSFSAINVQTQKYDQERTGGRPDGEEKKVCVESEDWKINQCNSSSNDQEFVDRINHPNLFHNTYHHSIQHQPQQSHHHPQPHTNHNQQPSANSFFGM